VKIVLLEIARNSLENKSDKEPPKLLLLPSMLRYVMSKEMNTNNDIETYCLAWFNPEGIRFKQLPIEAQSDSDEGGLIMKVGDHRGVESPQSFAPGGEQLYAGSEDEKKKNARRQPMRATSLRALENGGSDQFENCLYQWDGCQTPEEVLLPFGYAPSFIQEIIELARPSKDMDAEESQPSTQSDKSEPKAIFENSGTFAVRGATLARPEGYCLCWEHDDLSLLAATGGEGNENTAKVPQQERDQLQKRRRRRRRELQREVLPKVLNSAPQVSDGRPQLGIEQPCVQFLNLDSSHAVRLFTPPFKPAPAPAPITVFCVGIATEDACFMSGLKRRFEFGHMYPETARDDLIERSPICLCTDIGTGGASTDKDMANETADEADAKDESFNSDDSSCDMSMEAAGGDPGFKCACPFSGLGDATDAENAELPVGQICRGKLCPGSWHCYVAVFDGVESRIRIDGEPEITRCSFPLSTEVAFLDGLTIGADHAFDMSLCFGQGSDGEGEGAIAELAVFKGKLDALDIGVMERRLMTKYGIPSPTLPEHERADENHYYRLAHAMLSHPPGHKLFLQSSQRIPLKYLAKHRLVSWRQTNPVTGEPISVQRIGCKQGESSSDW